MSAYFGDFVDINGLPLLACLMVSVILVYLGMHVIERKVIFVDLALAQIAAFGVMWAILMGYSHDDDTLAVTLYSLAFTVVGALVFSITRTSNKRVPHEALIGIVYVTATAAGLVLADRFALGTEALKELVAGRVALVTGDIVTRLAPTCVVVGVFHLMLYRVFLRISSDPEQAKQDGFNLRLWDFLFYVSFGVLITQVVTVLGVLPVFAYLVIPAVGGALLFETVLARLVFGWAFAAVGSLVGLEVARHENLDPGPTIVCLFSAALVLLGVGLFIRARGFTLRSIVRTTAYASLFVLFLLGTLLFRKPEATNELQLALQYAQSSEVPKLRQALASFEKFPDSKAQWMPLVVSMLKHPDHVAREDAVSLLGSVGDQTVLPSLLSMLDDDQEGDDAVREKVVGAIRELGDPSAVSSLVLAASEEPEADIAVEMCEAAFDLGGQSDSAALRRAADLLVAIIADEGAPRGARRDAEEHLRNHLQANLGATNQMLHWWLTHRVAVIWEPRVKRFSIAE